MRPAGNPYEEAFINRYIDPLNPNVDAFGNRWIDVGTDEPTVVWSSHTDTVHNRGGFQLVEVNKRNIASLAPKQKDSNCLGADCTTGVWLMLEMIEAGVPGRYIFHRDEENGGNGSKWIATNNPSLLHGIKYAIAFDRRGVTDVITHQGSKTCSQKFALSLCAALGGGYKPNSNGMFTDTKNYRRLVPECTNISVGYYGAHSPKETQDLGHLKWLRDTLCQIDLSNLVVDRDPAEPDPVLNYGYYAGGGSSFGSYRTPTTIQDLVRDYPYTIATILREHGWDFESLDWEIYERNRPAKQTTTGRNTIRRNQCQGGA